MIVKDPDNVAESPDCSNTFPLTSEVRVDAVDKTKAKFPAPALAPLLFAPKFPLQNPQVIPTCPPVIS